MSPREHRGAVVVGKPGSQSLAHASQNSAGFSWAKPNNISEGKGFISTAHDSSRRTHCRLGKGKRDVE